MTEDLDKNYLTSLDRRVSEHDSKLAGLQREYERETTQLRQEIKEVTNRVNMGLSPSVQSVIRENAQSQLLIKDLERTLDKAINEMRSVVRESAELTKLMVSNFDEHKLGPVKEEVGLMKKTLIYGLVGALLCFAGQKGINILWDRVFEKRTVAPAAP